MLQSLTTVLNFRKVEEVAHKEGVWESVVEGKERARVSKSAKGSGKEYQG